MKDVTFRLIGTRSGQPDFVHFTLPAVDTQEPEDQRKAWEHFQENCNLKGLHFQLRGGGLITLKAEQTQLRQDVVDDIRRHAQNALDQI